MKKETVSKEMMISNFIKAKLREAEEKLDSCKVHSKICPCLDSDVTHVEGQIQAFREVLRYVLSM